MAFVTFSPLRSSSLNRPHLPRVCKATTRMTSDASVQNVSRRAFLSTLVSLTGSVIGVKALDASNDLQLKVVTEGKGPAPQIGDLVGIRFKGSYNGVVFDNLFNSTEPYFYRVGSGSVLKVCSGPYCSTSCEFSSRLTAVNARQPPLGIPHALHV